MVVVVAARRGARVVEVVSCVLAGCGAEVVELSVCFSDTQLNLSKYNFSYQHR